MIQTGYLGDVVFTSPLIAALRSRFPRATVLFCGTPKGADIARCIPGVDQAIPFDKRGADNGLGWLRIGRRLRPIDVAIVAHTSARSALLARACEPRLAVGFRSLLGRAFFDAVEPWDTALTYPERHLRLARALGADAPPVLALRPPPSSAARAEQVLAGRRAAALAIGSEWGTKRWIPERYGSLVDFLAQRGFVSVLVGSHAERDIAARVIAAAQQRDSILDCMGWGLADTLALLARCRVAIGGDTGLVHASRALGIRTVALFGPTDPGAHLFENRTRVVKAGVPCQPCHAHGPQRCPLGHHDCMNKLSVDEVLGAALTAAGVE